MPLMKIETKCGMFLDIQSNFWVITNLSLVYGFLFLSSFTVMAQQLLFREVKAFFCWGRQAKWREIKKKLRL